MRRLLCFIFGHVAPLNFPRELLIRFRCERCDALVPGNLHPTTKGPHHHV